MLTDLSLTLYETADTDDGVVHLDNSDMRMLGIIAGDVIAVEGSRRAYLTAQPAYIGDHNQRLARVSTLTAKNLGFLSGQKVRLLPERIKPPVAELLTVQAEDDLDQLHILARQKQMGHFWHKRVIVVDDELRVPTLDRYQLPVKVVSVQPQGPVQIGHATQFAIATRRVEGGLIRIGGLRETYRTCQALAQARFTRGLSSAARSVLLTGPAGSGKAMLVSRLAQEFRVEIQVLDANQLVDKALTQGSLELGGLLSEMGRRGKGILLIDHLDALNVADSSSSTIAAAAHAVMVQVCSLLDEIPTQPNVLVFGVSSGPLNKKLSYKRRFDVTVPVDPPNRWGRSEILLLATEQMTLDDDVDLASFASATAGMTAQDIFQMTKTAYLLATGAKVNARDLTEALRAVTPSALSEVTCDVPMTSWDEIAGLDDIKQLLRETLGWSLYQYDKFALAGVKPPRSVLLSGGQGTGKTSLVRALASYIPMHFIEISCPVLLARHQTDSYRFIRDSFALARRKTPCLIFLDDIDVLFTTNVNDSESASTDFYIVAQLMAELDQLASITGVVVIAATNRPDRLTPDILSSGRFDFAMTLPMPDAAARKKIFMIHARKLPLAADIDFEKIAYDAQGMSSLEIANLCNRVGLMALRQSMSTYDGGGFLPMVTANLFDQALRSRKN